MGTKYSSVSVSGYNSSPPPDDGSTSSTNQVTWATIKTKLPDPLNTAIAAINSGLTSAFDYSARSITTGDTAIASDNMKTIEVASTVSSNVTVTLSDAATMAAGYCVEICNRSNFTATVTRATTSDVIDNTASAVILSPQSSIGYKVNASANGYLTRYRGTITTSSTSAASSGSVGGVSRKAQMSIPTATSLSTFTADEIIVSTALGGTTQILSSYSQSINLATTGAGGMDTGSAPTNGFVSLYAIAKTDGTKSILACAVATSTGSIYGGANMPAGYSYSALLGILPTNGSSQFVAGMIQDRRFMYQTYVSIFTAHAVIPTITSQSISSAVPTVARTAGIVLGTTEVSKNCGLGVSGDSTGTGGNFCSIVSGGNPYNGVGGMAALGAVFLTRDVPLITSQTVYLIMINLSASGYCYVSEYTF